MVRIPIVVEAVAAFIEDIKDREWALLVLFGVDTIDVYWDDSPWPSTSWLVEKAEFGWLAGGVELCWLLGGAEFCWLIGVLKFVDW